MEPLGAPRGWYGGRVDSEPDLPEANQTPPARTPAARVTSTPKKTASTPRKPAAPRQPRSTASAPAKSAAAKPAAKSTAKPTAAKPAAASKAVPAAKPASPRAATPRTRATTPKAPAAKPTASKSVAAPNAEKTRTTPTKRTAVKKPTTDDAETTVTTPATPASTDLTPATTKAPAKRQVRRPAPKLPLVAPAVPVEAPAVPVEAPAVAVEEQLPVVEAKPQELAIVEPDRAATGVVLKISGLIKRFGDTTAVAGIDLEISAGSFFGIVGPNGAGKTTTLSMVTGLLRPDAGTIIVHGADVWNNPVVAKRTMGVLPDRLRLFDRLTGAQLLYYSGILHGLSKSVVRSRSSDLAAAFGLEDSLDRLVADYSAGMTKKIAIAAAMIHSPRLLVLDEPFESVDPVSAANVIEILQKYVAAGGTVVMSSHTMNLIERICDSVAVIVNGAVLATGTMNEVRGDKSLEDRFVELAGGRKAAEGMEWLHKFSD